MIAPSSVEFILGQGVGLFNTSIGWSGNLTDLEPNNGYWINFTNTSNTVTQYNIPILRPNNIPSNLSKDFLTELGPGNNLIGLPLNPLHFSSGEFDDHITIG